MAGCATVSGELDEILAKFGKLIDEYDEESPSQESDADNFRCVDCVDCVGCRFCTQCEACEDCTYCDACVGCRGCTQSRQCQSCSGCSHIHYCMHCEDSSYLALCFDCEQTVQCFACVGLSGAEFCILNEKYPRGEYFAKVAKLRAALDAKIMEGWRPPWFEEDEPHQDHRAEPAEATGSVRPPEASGSWPPIDRDTARHLDRVPSEDEIWEELDQHPAPLGSLVSRDWTSRSDADPGSIDPERDDEESPRYDGELEGPDAVSSAIGDSRPEISSEPSAALGSATGELRPAPTGVEVQIVDYDQRAAEEAGRSDRSPGADPRASGLGDVDAPMGRRKRPQTRLDLRSPEDSGPTIGRATQSTNTDEPVATPGQLEFDASADVRAGQDSQRGIVGLSGTVAAGDEVVDAAAPGAVEPVGGERVAEAASSRDQARGPDEVAGVVSATEDEELAESTSAPAQPDSGDPAVDDAGFDAAERDPQPSAVVPTISEPPAGAPTVVPLAPSGLTGARPGIESGPDDPSLATQIREAPEPEPETVTGGDRPSAPSGGAGPRVGPRVASKGGQAPQSPRTVEVPAMRDGAIDSAVRTGGTVQVPALGAEAAVVRTGGTVQVPAVGGGDAVEIGPVAGKGGTVEIQAVDVAGPVAGTRSGNLDSAVAPDPSGSGGAPSKPPPVAQPSKEERPAPWARGTGSPVKPGRESRSRFGGPMPSKESLRQSVTQLVEVVEPVDRVVVDVPISGGGEAPILPPQWNPLSTRPRRGSGEAESEVADRGWPLGEVSGSDGTGRFGEEADPRPDRKRRAPAEDHPLLHGSPRFEPDANPRFREQGSGSGRFAGSEPRRPSQPASQSLPAGSWLDHSDGSRGGGKRDPQMTADDLTMISEPRPSLTRSARPRRPAGNPSVRAVRRPPRKK